MCLCGGGGCGSVDGSDGGGGVGGSGGSSGVCDGGESVLYRSGGCGGSVVHRSVEVYCAGVVDILALGGVLVVEVVEGVELVVGCVVKRVAKLVLGCVNGRGYFLCSFNLKLVEMNGLSVDGFLFGMVIWVDCFIL